MVVLVCVSLDAGAPLSAMDGVLVAVKDEIDCLPYPTTGNNYTENKVYRNGVQG